MKSVKGTQTEKNLLKSFAGESQARSRSKFFASKARNVQIFFTDFFQIDDVYNRPGTSGDANWSLRLTNDFATKETINLQAILKAAIIARGKDFADKNKDLLAKLG